MLMPCTDGAANQHRSSVNNRVPEYRPFGLLNSGDGRRRMSKVEVDKALVGAQLRAEKVRAGITTPEEVLRIVELAD